MDAFAKTGRQEDIRILWSDLPATLVITMPATVIYFTDYNPLKVFLSG